jgi:hypothetical protein
MVRRLLTALLVVAVALAFSSVVMAQEDNDLTHIYGIVFYDANGNGVWDPGEMGAPGVPVILTSPDGELQIQLMSAPLLDELEEGQPVECSPFTAITPCAGTWGLIPAGPEGTMWEVRIVPPAGATVTSPHPQLVAAQPDGSELIVQIGILPVGVGGPPGIDPAIAAPPAVDPVAVDPAQVPPPAVDPAAEPPELLPETGGPAYELAAAGLFLLAGTGLTGAGLVLKSRRPK